MTSNDEIGVIQKYLSDCLSKYLKYHWKKEWRRWKVTPCKDL